MNGKVESVTTSYTRQQVALYLGLDPFNEKTWPVETLDRLIKVSDEQGAIAFMKECREMTRAP